MFPRLPLITALTIATSALACTQGSTDTVGSAAALTAEAPGEVTAYVRFKEVFRKEDRPEACAAAAKCYVVALTQSTLNHDSRISSNFESDDGHMLDITSEDVTIASLGLPSSGAPPSKFEFIGGRPIFEGDLVKVAFSQGQFKKTAPGAYAFTKVDSMNVVQEGTRLQCVAILDNEVYYANVQPVVRDVDLQKDHRTFMRLEHCPAGKLGACSNPIVATKFDTSIITDGKVTIRGQDNFVDRQLLDFRLGKIYSGKGTDFFKEKNAFNGQRESTVTVDIKESLPGEERVDSLTIAKDATAQPPNANISWTYKIKDGTEQLEESVPMHCSRWK